MLLNDTILFIFVFMDVDCLPKMWSVWMNSYNILFRDVFVPLKILFGKISIRISS